MESFCGYIKKERTILIICLLVFVASLAYAFCYQIRPAVDAATYHQIATNISEGAGYRLDTDIPLVDDGSIAYQGPVYPFFLAGIYKVFGAHYQIVWVVHALLRALTAFLLFLISVKIFGANEGRKMGWISAGLFGFYPDLIEMGSMLMSETLFIFLTVLFIYIFVIFYKKISILNTVSLALVFGLIMLVRSSVSLFLPVIAFCFYKKRAYRFFILFCILFGLIMTPWAVRNYIVYDKFIPTMANFGFNPWVGNHEGGDGEGGNMPELHQAIKDYGHISANEYAFEQFKSFVKAHPFIYIKLTATRVIKYFSLMRPMGFWFYQSGWSQLIFVLSSVFASVLLFTLGFAGIFAIFKKERKNKELFYLIAFAFLTCLSIVPFLIETRYRLPVYPFLAIFAGFFVYRFIFFKQEYLKYLTTAFLVLCFNTALNFALEYNKIIEKLSQMFD